MSLVIAIKADSKFPIDRKRLRTSLANAWAKYDSNVETNLSVTVVGGRKMAQLNSEYLKGEGAADVLAFPQQGGGSKEVGFVSPKGVPLELGDIVICYPLAREQAARLGVLVDDRIEDLALHGLKNIIGANAW